MYFQNFACQRSHSLTNCAMVVAQTGLKFAGRVADAALFKKLRPARFDHNFAINENRVNCTRRTSVHKLTDGAV